VVAKKLSLSTRNLVVDCVSPTGVSVLLSGSQAINQRTFAMEVAIAEQYFNYKMLPHLVYDYAKELIIYSSQCYILYER
jgi:hypothetical protein